MSEGVVVDEDKVTLLTSQLASPPFSAGNVRMLLSTFSGPVDHATDLGTIAAGELTVAGYARQNVAGWTTPILDADFRAVTRADPVTFLNTGVTDSPTVFTWGLVDNGSGKLMAGGAFDLAFVIGALIGAYTTTPYWRGTGVDAL